MLGQLIPVGGGDSIPLLKPLLVVGRRPSCDIRLEFANVSSHHCKLEFINGYWHATDTSRNGTKVNGERIDEKFLQPGDTISFARHVFEIQYVPDPTAVPPVEEVDPFAMSLLEKAGLIQKRKDRVEERRKTDTTAKPASRPSGNRPTQSGTNPPKRAPYSDDDDQALEWLNS